MGDMKDKFLGFMEKVNNQLPSSSGNFKGQGRVLGSSSPLLEPSNVVAARWANFDTNNKKSNAKPLYQKPSDSDNKIEEKSPPTAIEDSNTNKTKGFDSFEPLITSSKRNVNGFSLNVIECPACGKGYASEEEVTEHVESCLSSSESNNNNNVVDGTGLVDNATEIDGRIGAYLSGNPSAGSVEIVLRLFRNVIKKPENAKFRRVRLSNATIKEAIGEVTGGVELLECVGFVLREEDGEMWAVMDVPSEERIIHIKKTISVLEPTKVQEPVASTPTNVVEPSEPKKIDRQIRVFFSVPESVAATIDLPDSFYKLALEEVKREADLKKKKLAESQMLIPRSYKEKQAKALKKRYAKTVIRIQFPDGVVLQGVFSPRESTSILYEFVSTALKDPSLEFELFHPIKRGAIAPSPQPGKRDITLEEEDLAPAAHIKFKPYETVHVMFTGLCNELLEISEPLVVGSAVASR